MVLGLAPLAYHYVEHKSDHSSSTTCTIKQAYKTYLLLLPNSLPYPLYDTKKNPWSRTTWHRPGLRLFGPSPLEWTWASLFPKGITDISPARDITLVPCYQLSSGHVKLATFCNDETNFGLKRFTIRQWSTWWDFVFPTRWQFCFFMQQFYTANG